MSFGSLFINHTPVELPISNIIVSPYWTDINLQEGSGSANYTVLQRSNGMSYIAMVDSFLEQNGVDIESTMILVAQWLDVCPFNDRCRSVGV